MIEREEVEKRLKNYLQEDYDIGPEEVNETTTLAEDLNFDSLDMVELVQDIEEEFDIDIADEEAEELKTFGQAVDFICKAMKKKEQE